MTFGQLIKRLFLYLGLAFAALTIFTLIFALSVHTHTVIPFRWVMLATFTALLVGAMIKTYTRYWTRPAFWIILAVLLCVHLGLFSLILIDYPEFRIVWYVPAVIVEGGIFGVVCGALLDRPNSSSGHASRT